MRLRRGARHPAAEPPRPQPTDPPETAPAPLHPDSLVYELLANVALRDLTVIERILSTISDVERGEQDPERLSLYYALDHDVTRLRRSAENALVLAGAQAPMGRTEPMTLLDVARAAASESADYTRVAVGQLPPVAVGPAVADDLAHTLAELMDNALSVSPTRAKVNVNGARASGGVLVVVEDEGIGIAPERLPDLNTRLTGPLVLDTASTRQMGLYVVAHLARRHGIYVQLQSRKHLGSTAVAFLPDRLLLELNATTAPPATTVPQQPAPPPMPAGPVPLAQRTPRGYQPTTNGRVGPVQHTEQGAAGPRPANPPAAGAQVPRQRSQQPGYEDATAPQPPFPRHAGPPAGQRQAGAPGPQNPYTQQGPNPYTQNTYAQPPAPPQPQAPYTPPNAGAPAGGQQQSPYPRPPAPVPPQPAAPAPMPPRAPARQESPPPVAPATVDRWAPTAQERAEPTDFTDQGLPRRTRPSGPRPFPGGAPREAAKPADPASVLADLEAFASGTADAAAQGGAPQRVSLTGAPPRMQLPPPAPPAGSPPPLLTDPAQEEF